MKKLTTLVLAAACGLCAMAQNTISQIDLTLDLTQIDYYIGNTEGNVNSKIRSNVSCTPNDAYSLNTGNSGLLIKTGDTQFIGIGYGDANISTDKTYVVSFYINKKDGYDFPSDLSTISFTLNGSSMTPCYVETWGANAIYAYMLLDTPADAPATTYTLTVENADKYGYPHQDFTGGNYLEGAKVKFQAKSISGKTFDKWVAEGLTLTSEQEKAFELTITMPANAVRITATYTDNTPTAVERSAIETFRTEDGRVICAEPFRIYSLSGADVTSQNGNLKSLYIVKTATAAQKVAL